MLEKPFQKNASQSSPSQNITSPENQQMPTKKASFKKITGSSSNIFRCHCFLFRGNVLKKTYFPKTWWKWWFTKGRLHKSSPPSTTPCLEIVSPNYPWQSKGTPPNGLLKGQWWWKIVPQKRPAISWGFTWQFGGWLGPLDCHGFFGISPNISRKARLSASCAMPRKPTVFRTWSWRGLKFNTGASPPQ